VIFLADASELLPIFRDHQLISVVNVYLAMWGLRESLETEVKKDSGRTPVLSLPRKPAIPPTPSRGPPRRKREDV
jgi:hypothetical protein